MKKLLIAIFALVSVFPVFSIVLENADNSSMEDGDTYEIGMTYDNGLTYKYNFRTHYMGPTNIYETLAFFESGSAQAVRDILARNNGNSITSSTTRKDSNGSGEYMEFLRINTFTNLYDVLDGDPCGFRIEKTNEK